LFVLFVLSLEWLGFDVGTFVFISAFLWLNGERRIR
jgi:putative tricarboxylic transport membrane protein